MTWKNIVIEAKEKNIFRKKSGPLPQMLYIESNQIKNENNTNVDVKR